MGLVGWFLAPSCFRVFRICELKKISDRYSFLLLRFFLGLFRALFWDWFLLGFSNSRDCRMFIALSWPSDIFTTSKVKTSSENAAIGKFEISSDNSLYGIFTFFSSITVCIRPELMLF